MNTFLLFLVGIAVAYAATSNIYTSNMVVNPTCMQPLTFISTGGWTSGSWTCVNTTGKRAFYASIQTSTVSQISQLVDVTMYKTYVDDSTTVFKANIEMSIMTGGSDFGTVTISCQNANKQTIGTSTWTQDNMVSTNGFSKRWFSDKSIPTGTRFILIEMKGTKGQPYRTCRVWYSEVSATYNFKVAEPATAVTGLLNGEGSHLHLPSSTLFFVERSRGTLSTYNLFRPLASVGGIVATGTATLTTNGQRLNLRTGLVEASGDLTLDTWDLNSFTNDGTLKLRPQGNNKWCLVGYVYSYDQLNPYTLQERTYDAFQYVPFGLLRPGFSIAVYNSQKTSINNFDYAKITVVSSSGNSVTVQFTTYLLEGNSAYQVLGSGYFAPRDVKVTADRSTAYITHFNDASYTIKYLSKINLNGASKDRSAATTVQTFDYSPGQIALDEANNRAYVVEFYNAGAGLWRVDLNTNTKQLVVGGLRYTNALAINKAATYAYVAEIPLAISNYVISQVNLQTGAKTSYAPVFPSWVQSLSWVNNTADMSLYVVSNYAIHAFKPGVSSQLVWSGNNTYSYSVAPYYPGRILIVQDETIIRADTNVSL